MKFKEIKPGMVIHCPKEEDARALLEHLDSLGYVWHNGANICAAYSRWHEHCDRTGYQILCGSETRKITNGGIDSYLCKITKFSDLIEPEANKANDLANSLDNQDNNLDNPQDNEISARELLEWFHNADADTIYKVFGISRLDEALAYYEPNEIIRRIEQHEAAKKAPKPVKVKEGYYCDIYTEDEQILNYIMYGVDEQTAKNDAREKAMQNTRETGSLTFADVKFVCEEDES